MSTLTDYVDARELHPDYEQRLCPDCGTQEWFKHVPDNDYWGCVSCGRYHTHTLEYPCPTCDVRMVYQGGAFECHNEECVAPGVDVDGDGLRLRLSGEAYPKHAHKPGMLMGECPVCGAETGVNGDPDGALICSECNDFYAGQYSDEWYCYAIWMRDPGTIRVNGGEQA